MVSDGYFKVQVARNWGSCDRQLSQGILIVFIVNCHLEGISTIEGHDPIRNKGIVFD